MANSTQSLLFVALTLALVVSVVSTDMTSITDSLSKAKKSLEKGGKMSSFSKVTMYGQAGAFMAVGVMETIKFLKTFTNVDDESKELKYMKEQFAVVNTKLDALDHDFEEVKAQIDWSTLKVNLGAYENTINALHQQLLVYLEAPMGAKDMFKELFMTSYHYDYNDATLKVYNALTKPGIFHDVFSAVRTFFKEDHRKVALFTGMAMRILQKGRVVLAAYLQFENNTKRIEDEQKAWRERQKRLEEVAGQIDAAVEAAWSSQYRIDVDELAAREAARFNNSGLSKRLHTFLTEKFPWRQWFVLVYTFTDNNDKDRYFDNCGEFFKANVANKVVIVNQLAEESTESEIDINRFWDAIPSFNGLWQPYVQVAKRLFNMVSSSCDFYRFKGVIEGQADTQIRSPENRTFTRSAHVFRALQRPKEYKLIVFS